MHLDGNNLMPFLKGEEKESPREGFLYWSDDGDLMAVRVQQWKVAFMEQNTESDPKTPLGVWQGEFTALRAPMMYNLRSDPFERGTESIYYGDWFGRTGCSCSCRRRRSSARWLESFKEFPPRAKAASFTVERRDGEDHDGERAPELTPGGALVGPVTGRQRRCRPVRRDYASSSRRTGRA